MPTVDFTDWAAPDLVLTLGGETFHVPPPSVAGAQQILACVARAEVNLGLHPGPVPDELVRVLEQIDEVPLGAVSLGPAYQQMVDAGVPVTTLDRMAYYALFFWARGKGRADAIATTLWTPDATVSGEDEGKAPSVRPSRSTSGRRTASASRTRTASTPTIGSPQR